MYKRLHNIILPVLILGIINIYDTYQNIIIKDFININDSNLFILIFLSILFFYSFFYFQSQSLELELILAISFIGLSFLLISNDLILFFLSLELYSLSVYLLVYNNSKPIISLIYFLIGSISSLIILLSIAFLYLFTGSLDLNFILEYFNTFNQYHEGRSSFFISLLIFALLFKIGSAPFQWWVIRIYSNMDYKILLYQSIIPKIVYTLILINLIKFDINIYLLVIPSLFSLLIGAIAPLTLKVKDYKSILAYSSIYNTGLLLLGIASYGYLMKNGIDNIYNILEFLFIYSINTFHLFIALLIPYTSPFYFITFIISLFSLIGIPPFAGFYAKLNIIVNSMNTTNPIFILGVVIILITTLIASFFYLKFVNYIYFNINKEENSYILKYNGIYYLYSLLTIIITLYPLFSSFFSPFFDLF